MSEIDDIERQMRALQSKLRQVKGDTLSSIWAVYDPTKVGVWCSKSDCPLSGRKVSMETVSLDEEQEMETGEEKDSDFVVGVKVIRDYGPTTKNHALGIIASFRSQEEGSKFIQTYYKQRQSEFGSVPIEHIPQLELVEITLTE